MNPTLTYAEICDLVRGIDPVAYGRTRNHLAGAVTKLSPYITRGVMSLPAVRDIVLERHSTAEAEKFIQELAWREYFQNVFAAKGDAIFSDLRFVREDWLHENVVASVLQAQTGITVLDARIQSLYETGYMHNHARMWVAMLSCNVAKAHWFNMSRYLYYHLIDGDLASNMLSWQWVAGTSAAKQYVAHQELINACSGTTQTGTYLDVPRELVGASSVPVELSAEVPFTYTTTYPTSDHVTTVADTNVFLYHPWHIDPKWRQGEAGEQIFVVDPAVFDKFPVSTVVMDHMLTLVRTHLPKAKIFVGAPADIPGIGAATAVYTRAHPTLPAIFGIQDPVPKLFPEATGYYPSFFKFWQAAKYR